jgi:hypothetical protein
MGKCEAGRTGGVDLGGLRCRDKNCTGDVVGVTHTGDTLWGMGVYRRREKVSLDGIVELLLRVGDQTSKEVSLGGCGAAADLGFTC